MMATSIFQPTQWHSGELSVQRQLHAPTESNPSAPFLTQQGAYFLPTCPIIALGTISPDGSPWASLIGGKPGFAAPLGNTLLALKAKIGLGDPLHETFGNWGTSQNSTYGEGMVAGLGIKLETRQRLKFFGRVERDMRRIEDLDDGNKAEKMLGMVMQVTESLGSCPKYLNKVVQIHHVVPEPRLHQQSLPLPAAAQDLVESTSMFFVASRNGFESMDVNYRGGHAGFVRVVSNDKENGTVIIWPEYSGNRLYQTLGNFKTTPLAGVTIPNFPTGDILYLTGSVEMLVGEEAATLLPRSSLAIKMKVTAAKFVQEGLNIRGSLDEDSPYNPPVRYLKHEKPNAASRISTSSEPLTAQLTNVQSISSTLSRFTFQLVNDRGQPVTKPTHKAGQYVALSFAKDLSKGYRHMDNSDPASLNDDYTRTFTISSPPQADNGKFDITIRSVGAVTKFLFKSLPRHGLEVQVLGLAGDLCVDATVTSTFVAGGIGVTPYLAAFSALDVAKTELLWSVRETDVPLLHDLFSRTSRGYVAGLAGVTSIFMTGVSGEKREEEVRELLLGMGVREVVFRRMIEDDVVGRMGKLRKWYICAGKGLTSSMMGWLKGQEDVATEDFGY